MRMLSNSRSFRFTSNLITLNNRIEYSLSALNTFMVQHFWAFLCWIFGTYLLPTHSIIYIMIFMVTIDFVTGIWKSLKLKEALTSKKLGDTIEKMILYMIGIITSFVLQEHIGIDIVKPLWVFGTLIITREYVSVIENIEAITGTKLVAVVKSQMSKLLPGSDKKTKDDRISEEDKSE